MKNNGILGSVVVIFVWLCFTIMVLLIFLNISDRHSINDNGEVLVANHLRFIGYDSL
jgi:hypothetical protein